MSTLRQRIKRNWTKILVLIDHENCGPGFTIEQTEWPRFEKDDFRPVVVMYIRRIAEARVTPAHEVRADLKAVAATAKKLSRAINQLPPHIHAQLGGSDALLPFIEAESVPVPVRTETTITLRKRIAAAAAFDLLTDYGPVPTLTDAAPYIQLTALLYKTATGEKADLAKHCKAHLDAIEESGQPVYSGRASKLRDGPTLTEARAQGLTVWRAPQPSLRQQRRSQARQNAEREKKRAVAERLLDLPLDPVLDAVLGR